MSALPPKADMVQHNRDGRFVAEASNIRLAGFSLRFCNERAVGADNLLGGNRYCRRDRDIRCLDVPVQCERKLPCLADRPIAVGGDHLADRVGLPLWASLEAEIYMGTATVLSALCQKRTSTTSFDHLVAAAPGYVGTVSSF